jgi:acid stress chaperone HdeA
MQTLLVSGLAAAAILTGCSTALLNQGGETKCKDFTSADESRQKEVINKMIKDQRGTDPMALELNGTRLAVLTYCQTIGKQDSRISEAPHL